MVQAPPPHTNQTARLSYICPMAKKTYFASDFHLGATGQLSSTEREQKIVRWLDFVKDDAAHIYLLGDVFDFWFEYKQVIPKGYTRLFGKLAELTDAGIPITFFIGNHDMWMFRYFEEELGIPILRKPKSIDISGKKFLIGHGDGLGPGDHGYKFIKKIFANPTCQWFFARIHPNLGVGIASYWSRKSRAAQKYESVNHWLGEDKEWLAQYANQKLDETFFDYFVFGHRHIPIDLTLNNGKSRYINLGEWLSQYSYAVFDGKDIQIHFFESDSRTIYP